MIDLRQGDCLELMKDIPNKSIDMILCDLPYGTTACKWDNVIPFEPLWEQYNRIIKRGGIISLFGSEPFSSRLRIGQINKYKYDWIYEKANSTGFQTANIMPLRNYETISVFYNTFSELYDTTDMFDGLKKYMIKQKELSGLSNKEIQTLLGNYMGSHYFTVKSQFTIPTETDYKKLQKTGFFQRQFADIYKEYKEQKNLVEKNINTYNPQGIKPYGKENKRGSCGDNWSEMPKNNYIQEYTNYPKQILKFNYDKEKYHPTQKPVALLEYLIKTYTNENETVLDNCMGSGSTGVACLNTNRNFIGIELNENYFNIAKNRIEKAQNELSREI